VCVSVPLWCVVRATRWRRPDRGERDNNLRLVPARRPSSGGARRSAGPTRTGPLHQVEGPPADGAQPRKVTQETDSTCSPARSRSGRRPERCCAPPLHSCQVASPAAAAADEARVEWRRRRAQSLVCKEASGARWLAAGQTAAAATAAADDDSVFMLHASKRVCVRAVILGETNLNGFLLGSSAPGRRGSASAEISSPADFWRRR
jgi:hypothetical protein